MQRRVYRRLSGLIVCGALPALVVCFADQHQYEHMTVDTTTDNAGNFSFTVALSNTVPPFRPKLEGVRIQLYDHVGSVTPTNWTTYSPDGASHVFDWTFPGLYAPSGPWTFTFSSSRTNAALYGTNSWSMYAGYAFGTLVHTNEPVGGAWEERFHFYGPDATTWISDFSVSGAFVYVYVTNFVGPMSIVEWTTGIVQDVWITGWSGATPTSYCANVPVVMTRSNQFFRARCPGSAPPW